MLQSLPAGAAAYWAGKSSAVLFDVSDRAELTLTGKDRQTFLHGFCTNEIKKLTAGQGQEAFVPTIKGKTLGHIFVFAEADRLVIDSVPAANDTLLPHLDRYLITEDVQLTDTTAHRRLFFVTGPETLEKLGKIAPELQRLQPFQSLSLTASVENSAAEISLYARRTDWLQEQGVLISVAADAGEACQQVLTSLGVVSGEAATFAALQVEAGFPLFGRDFNTDNLAQEIDRTGQAISFHKGCYLGQEPIARIDALGHVNRLLCRIEILEPTGETLTDSTAALTGASVVPADNPEGKTLGSISFAATLPLTKDLSVPENLPITEKQTGTRTLAFAFLRREHAAPGTDVLVSLPGHLLPARVIEP